MKRDAVIRAELAARAAFEAHDPDAFELVRVARIRATIHVYWPDYQMQGDCVTCGRPKDQHPK